MTDLFAQLAAPFPRDAVHWRAQSLTKAGDKAMALAYIDARNVMDRLDEACGPSGWQDSYTETPKGRVVCTIKIKIGDEWIAKSDGAGDTAVEGEKGGISDAFKRAAVKWGIGRYLYSLDAPWVPCEAYKDNRDKWVWKKWADDPWKFVRGPNRSSNAPANEVGGKQDTASKWAAWGRAEQTKFAQFDLDGLKDWHAENTKNGYLAKLERYAPETYSEASDAYASRLSELSPNLRAAG